MEYITGKITLQMIFLQYWAAYCIYYKGKIRDAVHDNVQKILNCRTSQLGFHLYQCPKCSSVRLIPHSCKSRFCSSCGKINTDRWSEDHLSNMLSVGYHHLIFTIPWQLRAICLLNRKIMFSSVFICKAFNNGLGKELWMLYPRLLYCIAHFWQRFKIPPPFSCYYYSRRFKFG